MKFTRRRFIQSGVAFGSSVGIGFGLSRSHAAASLGSAATVQAPPLDLRFEYKGRKVRILDNDQNVLVWINGKQQMHIKKLALHRYASHIFPFRDSIDIVDLVKAIIDAEDAELVALT